MIGVSLCSLAFNCWPDGIPGKVGQDSAAAKYAAATEANQFSIESEKPYAEVLTPTPKLISRRTS